MVPTLLGMSQTDMTEEGYAQFVAENTWRFAKTMPQCPHWYVVRSEQNDAPFAEAVLFIRENGFDCRWMNGPMRKYLDYGEHYYWTMGAPVEETIIINRCLKTDNRIDQGRMFVAQ